MVIVFACSFCTVLGIFPKRWKVQHWWFNKNNFSTTKEPRAACGGGVALGGGPLGFPWYQFEHSSIAWQISSPTDRDQPAVSRKTLNGGGLARSPNSYKWSPEKIESCCGLKCRTSNTSSFALQLDIFNKYIPLHTLLELQISTNIAGT